MANPEKYKIGKISVLNIRNRNEPRVASLIFDVLEEFPDFAPATLDLQDIYALTLNRLKPRYAQECSIVLNEVVTDGMIKFQLRKSIQIVVENPAH